MSRVRAKIESQIPKKSSSSNPKRPKCMSRTRARALGLLGHVQVITSFGELNRNQFVPFKYCNQQLRDNLAHHCLCF